MIIFGCTIKGTHSTYYVSAKILLKGKKGNIIGSKAIYLRCTNHHFAFVFSEKKRYIYCEKCIFFSTFWKAIEKKRDIKGNSKLPTFKITHKKDETITNYCIDLNGESVQCGPNNQDYSHHL